ncbi:MAG: DUF4856 domain-containing protein [Flavobacteriales bacterium]
MKKKIIILSLTSLMMLNACKKEDELPALQIPTSYDGSNFLTNTNTQRNVLSQLAALTDEAKKGRNAANTVERSALEQLFNQGNPALASVITNYFKTRIEGNGGIMAELANASGSTWIPATPDGISQGGVYGGYLFDEFGVEQEQLLEKGQFGATLYNHAISLMSGNITLATVDQLLAIFGAKPAFANSGSNNVSAEVRDVAMANYAARRDKNDGTGMYSQMKRAFIKLQAAVKAGADYNTDKNEALKTIQTLWEKINAATIINYCHSPIARLSATSPTDQDKAAALHAIGEGIGFIEGFKTINPAVRKISDAQINEILALFNAAPGEPASVYQFALAPEIHLPKLQQAITKLQTIYGFTNQEIDEFKNNWVAIQNR